MESTTPNDPAESERLLVAAAGGDQGALRCLLEMHRGRLRRMVALRLDSRVAARVDASDVVQEAMFDAARKLADYERNRPLAFYPWLHRLTADRLADVHRLHRRQGRDVAREECAEADASSWLLADRLVAADTTPGMAMVREEQHRRVRSALAELAPRDREVLVMRHIEDLSVGEIAAILDISESAVKMRHLRAIERIREVLERYSPGSSS
ncbi:ECF RNA polymerase sigma factor SigD [Aquisphaera giovannonii]|uniref:ECF RNA polymerase sigma factor SigD n=1 Tax=Aquisphaera giovannonii TaxID=406548 RepID=A0A5B9W8Y0_9BACT|nr:sigma-70 family RNA polymerase sigma factor [Aquisphaera giovannonii]QEH37072.1 ECF RNA polymerase sigma factor SigD [Aquisphaera giovannonii]